MRVLLVEDETLVRRFIRTLIDWEASGYTIVGEASNGEEAWKLLQEHEVDIVLTDIRMPLLDGFGLIERMTEAGLSCEVAILSSYDDFDYVRTALKLQVSDYVHKATMSSAELLACLDKTKEDWIKRQERKLASDWSGDTEESRRLAVRARLLTMAVDGEYDAERIEKLSRQLDCWRTPFYAGVGIMSASDAPTGALNGEAASDTVLFECDGVWIVAGESDVRLGAEARRLEPAVYADGPIALRDWPSIYEELRQSLSLQLENRDIPLAYHTLVRKAIAFIRESYMEELTLEAVSGHVHVSPSYFSRLFQKETGTSFTEYLTTLRLERARRLLLDTDYPVYDIAERVGYRNARYFLKLFKESGGMTPTEYRMNHNSVD